MPGGNNASRNLERPGHGWLAKDITNRNIGRLAGRVITGQALPDQAHHQGQAKMIAEG